jgi:hypothetical protein
MVLSLLFAATACMRLTDENGNDVRVRWGSASLSAEKIVPVAIASNQVLKAQVKGSIYETGEQVSVFGTCLNATDEPISTGTFATMSAWYPNGTNFFSNGTMQEMQPGYYVAVSSMSAVQGTYLTEMVCHVNGSTEIAKAWGEWQNPMWVRRIAELNDSINNLNFSVNLTPLEQKLDNISVQIGNMSVNMTNSFEITWQNQNTTNTFINQTYQNLTQQLIYVASVANSSVDRNDSYLAWLIQQVMMSTGAPMNHSLIVEEDPDLPPIYKKTWTIQVNVLNEYNISIGYPLVSCLINTTNSPATVNVQMSPISNMRFRDGRSFSKGFDYSERISTLGDFNWTVWCIYN